MDQATHVFGDIRSIWVEAESDIHEWDASDHISSVEVEFVDESRWLAQFVTFNYVETVRSTWRLTGECLGGQYFWVGNPVLVERISRDLIEHVVAELIEQGTFETAFCRLELSDDDGPRERA